MNFFFAVSAQVKETIPCDLDVPYGIREGEKFDIFGANSLPQGCLIYHFLSQSSVF